MEYAPFQGVPEGKVKRDPREGTLQKGTAYIMHLLLSALL